MIFRALKPVTLAMTLTLCGSAALAQDAICDGAGRNGQWIGGDEAGSDIATVGNYLEQMALVMGGNEYVSLFTLTQVTDVRVEAAGRGAGDPIIDLLDSTGGVILSDDDSGGSAASRAETTLVAGTYCMALRSYDGGPMTAFVRIGRTEHAPLTEGTSANVAGDDLGSCETATSLGGIGASATGSVDEIPYWAFTLERPTAVSIRAENQDADPVLTLYGPDGALIAENDDFDGLNPQLDMTEPLAAGTYCIGVTALNDTALPISVSVNAYDPETALNSLYARGEAAPPLDGSVAFTSLGTLQTRLRQDVQAASDVTWFTVDVAESSLLLVEAIAAGNSDPWLIVYDDLGREIGQNDDYGDGLDSMVIGRVQEGTYLIGVKRYEDGQGFIRLLVERYVRATE
ncbi:ABC transporter substrate-binding protein [Yoonia sp.]|uniref:PPC domain-containing protein n=1 Tax=Yoonia sp. TaxID=2212373 RepID=UPI003F6BBF66